MKVNSESKGFGKYLFDLRSIAAFRILIGVNVLYNIIYYRLNLIGWFYGEDAITDEVLVHRFYPDLISFFFHIESEFMLYLIFGFMVLLSLCLIVGYYSKYCVLILFVLFANLLSRSPFTVHAVEFIIEVCLFWAMFLPLDHSIALRKESRAVDSRIHHLACFGIILQVFLIYFTSTITKTGEFWTNGLAIFSTTDELTHKYILSDFLARNYKLCYFFNYFTLVIEGCIAIAVLLSKYSKWFKYFVLISIPVLHIGIGLTLHVGPFFLSTFCFAVLFIPKELWNRFKINSNSIVFKTRPSKTLHKASIWSYFLSLLLVFVMMLMVQKSLNKWGKNSYLKSLVNKTPVVNSISKWQLNRPGIFLGIWDQPWWLFAPDPYHEMGTLMIGGRTQKGEFIDVLSQKPFKYRKDKDGQIYFDHAVQNQFNRSRFVLSFYMKRKLKTIPKEVFLKWLKKEMDMANLERKDKLVEVVFFFYTNTTSLKDGNLYREKKLLELANYSTQ